MQHIFCYQRRTDKNEMDIFLTHIRIFPLNYNKTDDKRLTFWQFIISAYGKGNSSNSKSKNVMFVVIQHDYYVSPDILTFDTNLYLKSKYSSLFRTYENTTP